MKKSLSMLLLPFLLIVGCDSNNGSSNADKTETIKPAVETQAVKTEPAKTIATPAPKEEAVAAVKENVKKAPMSGEEAYNRSCVNCHKSGVANAPKLGDTAAWAPRIAKGTDALYKSAISGIPGTAMMAKGTCGACNDAELKAAVDYMIANSK